MYLLQVDFQYPEKLPELHNDLPILLERMKIGKVEKLMGTSKQTLSHGLVLKKAHRANYIQ